MRQLQPSERDLAVIRLIARLNHATSHHIHALLFHGLSRNRCLDVLNRLTKLQYIERTDKVPLYGSAGGAAHYIYRLARRGHWLLQTDEPQAFRPRRQAAAHSLAVADCVVIFRDLERRGLVIYALQLEPDCHVVLGGVDLKPDLYVDLQHPRAGHMRLMVEMDMSSQGRRRILQKCWLYIRALEHLSEAEARQWSPWPVILFVAVDAERKRELTYILREVPEEYRRLFQVTTREELPAGLT